MLSVSRTSAIRSLSTDSPRGVSFPVEGRHGRGPLTLVDWLAQLTKERARPPANIASDMPLLLSDHQQHQQDTPSILPDTITAAYWVLTPIDLLMNRSICRPDDLQAYATSF